MNIRMAIMAAVISSTAVFTAHGADVSIPGANPKMPAVVYSDNIVDQTKIAELRKDLSALYDKRMSSQVPVVNKSAAKDKILDKSIIDYKAHNYSSSIYVLSGENRSIQFILPGTSNTSLMVNRGKGHTQYAKSNLGMIGIEVEPVKDTRIWAESGKSYAELTVEDMKAAFAKHNPGAKNTFIDGGKFTYPGIENGTWDVASSEGNLDKSTISTVNFSLKNKPNYMYHIGIITTDKNANYKHTLGLLANYTIPSIMEKPEITIPNTVDALGDFTYRRIEGTTLKKDIAKGGGFVRVYEADGLAQLLLVNPIKEGTRQNKILSDALRNQILHSRIIKGVKVNTYTVWHNNTPGILMDIQYPAFNAMEISYITRNDKNLFIHTIIANRNKKNISRDDVINLLIDVQMKGESMDSTSVISPLPEYGF
ncbi:hypothetical protein [Veillonella sp.]|uniref:hypothetical protein n=1 Tax=Veillonella sp. TaxID=1926307 RepID=UPI0035214C37